MCQVVLTTLLFLLISVFIIFCSQLEPDKDRCGFLTIPEEWKIVDDIIQQAGKGTREKGAYTFKSCSNLNGMFIVSYSIFFGHEFLLFSLANSGYFM